MKPRLLGGTMGLLLGGILAVGLWTQTSCTKSTTTTATAAKENAAATTQEQAAAPEKEAAAATQAPQPAATQKPAATTQKKTATPTQKPAATPTAKAAATSAKVPKDIIILKGNPMGGVKFLHTAHNKGRKIKCETCHHPSKTEKPATAAQQACSDCHSKTAQPPMKTNYKAAFHNAAATAGICIDCHKAENAKGMKAPTKCTECHKKENV